MNNWAIWAGVGLAAYLIYQNSLTSIAASTVAYIPTSNASGNEFSCPTGTMYVDSGVSSSSGGGYCE